jgi:membrane protein implicated in regulation of membrane protease activity
MAQHRRTPRELPIPEHPYRGSVILYVVLAVLLVLAATLTGGDVVDAVVVAAVFFVVATAWSWWRFSRRIRTRDANGRRDGSS